LPIHGQFFEEFYSHGIDVADNHQTHGDKDKPIRDFPQPVILDPYWKRGTQKETGQRYRNPDPGTAEGVMHGWAS